MKKLLATIAVIATLGAGVFALSAILPAGAQTGPSSSDSSSSGPPSADASGGACTRHGVLHDALAGLVQNGTLTQAQADAVVQAVKDVAKADAGNRPGRHPRARAIVGALQVAAGEIGVTPADLVQARRDGQSIADVATSKNVDPADVVKAIVDAGNQKIDELVANGTLTQQQADKAKARLPQMADRLVHATAPAC